MFRQMRDLHPVFKEKRQGRSFIHLFRYVDCVRALEDHHQWSSDIPVFRELLLDDAAIMIQDDPPDHTRFREAITPWVNRVSTTASNEIRRGFAPLARALSGPAIDVVNLADRLTADILVLVFGFQPRDLDYMKSWYSRFGSGVGLEFLEFEGPRVAAQIHFVDEMHKELNGFLDTLIDSPSEAIQQFVFQVDSAFENRHTTRSLLKSLIFASGHTLSNQISNTLEVIASQKEEHQLTMSTNAAYSPRLVADECTRIRPVFRGSHRVATKDILIGDIEVGPGDYLVTWNTSANLDETTFPNPEVIQVRDRQMRHLSFGRGIHRCVGAALGSSVITTVVAQVLRSQTRLSIETAVPGKDPWMDSFEALRINVQ